MSQLQQWLNPRSSAAKMAVLFTVVSVVFYATASWTIGWLPLVPERVVHDFTFWQLVTYAVLFDKSPFSFIFGILILVSIGGTLERHWGAKKLWIFSFAIAAVSGLVTVALSFLIPALGGIPFTGANVVIGSMWVAYGLLMGRGMTNFWGIPLTGNALAAVGAGLVLLSGLLGPTWLLVIPELIGLMLTFFHVRYGFPQDVMTRFGSWRLQRELSRRSSHLKVITGESRNTSRDSDKYLH